MDEYIKRGDALRIIREEGINQAEQYCDRHHPVVMAYGDCFCKIKGMPTSNVHPVVFCRDCKYTQTDDMEDPAIYCEKWDRWEMPPHFFCAYGRRKANGGT